MFTARYKPTLCKRLAEFGEKVRLMHGYTPAGLGSGEVAYAAEFTDKEGEIVEIPDGAKLERFLRTYTIKRERNQEHNPTADFPVSMVQDTFSETFSLLDRKGKLCWIADFPSKAGFRVTSY